MTTMPDLPSILALVLAGGLGATVQGITSAITTYRSGARARERDVLSDLSQWRQAAEDSRREAERELEWWRDRAAGLWQQCIEHGGDPGPLGSPDHPNQ